MLGGFLMVLAVSVLFALALHILVLCVYFRLILVDSLGFGLVLILLGVRVLIGQKVIGIESILVFMGFFLNGLILIDNVLVFRVLDRLTVMGDFDDWLRLLANDDVGLD